MTVAINKSYIQYMNVIKEITKLRLFLSAWKEAVLEIGLEFFDNSMLLEEALLPIDLRPKVDVIQQRINELTHDDRVFLSALLCFYEANLVSEQTIVKVCTLSEKRKQILIRLFENFIPTHFDEVKQ